MQRPIPSRRYLLSRQVARHAIKSVAMKELLQTTDPTIIAFAAALLQGEEIDCFQMDVHMSVLEGSIGILPRRLMVRERDLFRARAVMQDNGIEVSQPK